MKQIYVCENCGKQFDSWDDAWHHEAMHLGVSATVDHWSMYPYDSLQDKLKELTAPTYSAECDYAPSVIYVKSNTTWLSKDDQSAEAEALRNHPCVFVDNPTDDGGWYGVILEYKLTNKVNTAKDIAKLYTEYHKRKNTPAETTEEEA